jgi:hypothetical protein
VSIAGCHPRRSGLCGVQSTLSLCCVCGTLHVVWPFACVAGILAPPPCVLQERRYTIKQPLIVARENNFRPPFGRGDCVRVCDKSSSGYGHTGVILRLEGGELARLGNQAMIALDHNRQVITVPLVVRVTPSGILKYGFFKVPGLWIDTIPGVLSDNSRRRLLEVGVSCFVVALCGVFLALSLCSPPSRLFSSGSAVPPPAAYPHSRE